MEACWNIIMRLKTNQQYKNINNRLKILKRTHNRVVVILDKSPETAFTNTSIQSGSQACRVKLSIEYVLKHHYEEKKPNK